MATITFNQVGLSAGLDDRARSDGLATGAQVSVLVSPPGGAMEFIDVPADDSTSVSSLTGGPDTWTFTPSSNVYGSWLIQYTPPSGTVVRRIFAVRTPIRRLRIPAFNEKTASAATIANGQLHVADSDDNEGHSYKSWAGSLQQLYREVESGSARVTPTANATPKARTTGKIAAGWTSLLQSTAVGPATANPTVNTLVFCDASAGAVTVNLPTTHGTGDQVLVKLSSAAANLVTIDPNGSGTIDGGSSLVLSNDYEWALLISNSSNWFQIG